MLNCTYPELLNCLKIFSIQFFTQYFLLKNTFISQSIQITSYIWIVLTSILSGILSIYLSPIFNFIPIWTLTILFCKKTSTNSFASQILISIFSISLSLLIYFASTTISFLTTITLNISNDFLELIYINTIYFFLLKCLLKNTKLVFFITRISTKSDNKFFNFLFFLIPCGIIVSAVLNNGFNIYKHSIILSVIVFITPIFFYSIYKSVLNYYKRSQYDKELKEAYEIINKKDEEIKVLVDENLGLSKDIHSLKHKIRFLTFKTSSSVLNNEHLGDFTIRSLAKNKNNIDSIFSFAKATCDGKSIDFESEILADIDTIVPSYISMTDLEILLSDLITNAIISIDNSQSISRKLKLIIKNIDNSCTLSIYDSGIPFQSNTLLALGQCACSTHLTKGGSGMGFLNIFDTLKSSQASICIYEFNKDEYSKCITISFDSKNRFIIKSNRYLELKSQSTNSKCKICFKPL